jgi:hypothetical protein
MRAANAALNLVDIRTRLTPEIQKTIVEHWQSGLGKT